jgi:Sulfatase
VLPPSTLLDKALASPRQALAGLRDRDVYLMPLESYGAVTYDHPEAETFRAMRARFAAEIAAGGLHVVSSFLRAPTFGGASDLSHLSMLSGIDLTDPLRHDLLLTTRRPTLINLFQAAGYQTFGVYPALFWEWPEREYYGFENFIDGPMLQYPGPPMGYWSIPDQYAFARFESQYSRPAHPSAAPPRFVFMPTITTHFPFNPLPPFQPERERLLSGQPFAPAEVKAALTEKIDWLDMLPAYRRMIEYQWRWIGDWLRRPQPRDTVFILVGDHQPTANISGEGASWDVPIHILANDPALLAAFVRLGFTAGMEPPRQPLGGMHELPALLLGVTAR